MNFPSVSQFSIAKGTGGTNPPEMYIPLWWYSGSNFNLNNTTYSYWLIRGGTASSTIGSNNKLHTLQNWSVNTQFAFEVSLYTTNSNYAAYACLWNMTDNVMVIGSEVSTTSASFTVLRSGKLTLTDGKSYGVAFKIANASYICYITDASLIIFPS